jgi:hypothetical protein
VALSITTVARFTRLPSNLPYTMAMQVWEAIPTKTRALPPPGFCPMREGKPWVVVWLRGGGEAREEARVRAREGWDLEVYRFRGVVEGVFGGMKRRLGGAYLWERKPWTAMARAFLELIAYGLSRVLLSLLPLSPGTRRFTRQPHRNLTGLASALILFSC